MDKLQNIGISPKIGEVATSAASGKPDFSSPEATFRTLDRAIEAGDLATVRAAFAPGMYLPGDNLFSEFIKEMPRFSESIGKLLEDGPDRKVYEFHSDVNNDPQVMLLIDGNWLLGS